MGPTFRCRDIIYKTIGVICIRIIVLHCNFNFYIIFCSFTVDDLLVKRSLTAI